MKRTRAHAALVRATPAFLALALASSAAHAAGGMNLSWDDCGTFGQLQRNFACHSNSGVHVLVASVVAPVPMPQLNGEASVLDIVSDQPAIAPWWQIGTGACRPAGALIADFYFPTGPFACTDPWQGLASGTLSYTWGTTTPDRARLRTACGIPGSTSIDATTEYYLFKIYLSNQRSVGDGACGGCGDGACLVLRDVLLTQPAGVGNQRIVEQPFSRMYVQWQPGAPNVSGGCPEATPARSASWGSIKSLYR